MYTNDSAWEGSTVENPTVYSHLYHGEIYDARVFDSTWDLPVPNRQPSSNWKPVSNFQFADRLFGLKASHLLPPMRVVRTVTPVNITQPVSGVNLYVFDLGENIAGVTQLRVKGPRKSLRFNESVSEDCLKYLDCLCHVGGTVVTLAHSESVLLPNGTIQNPWYPCIPSKTQGEHNCANQTDQYILRGGRDEEIWSAQFSYHGFRYVQVEGLPEVPSAETIRGLVVHSDVPTRGSVEFLHSDVDQLNRIQDAIIKTQLNNLHSLPTDCPQVRV